MLYDPIFNVMGDGAGGLVVSLSGFVSGADVSGGVVSGLVVSGGVVSRGGDSGMDSAGWKMDELDSSLLSLSVLQAAKEATAKIAVKVMINNFAMTESFLLIQHSLSL